MLLDPTNSEHPWEKLHFCASPTRIPVPVRNNRYAMEHPMARSLHPSPIHYGAAGASWIGVVNSDCPNVLNALPVSLRLSRSFLK